MTVRVDFKPVIQWVTPNEAPEPRTRCRQKARGGVRYGWVLPYGFPDQNGKWQHGSMFPVRWDDGVCSVELPTGVEVPRETGASESRP